MPYSVMDNTVKVDTAAKLILIAMIARDKPNERFTSLMHLLNETYLKECYLNLKRGKAAGIDGRTLESYTDREINQAIKEIVANIKAKRYRPQPVRRVYIDKENGKQRPLGIPTVLDKVVQYACTRILEAIYEPTFLPLSFGYRPGRDAHGCVKTINHMIMQQKVNWILEADIEGFFDHVSHVWLIKCFDQRIADPRFIRLMIQFLKAGVMEGNRKLATTTGTPQGGILSPMFANIYLHYVLDLWLVVKEARKLKGYCQLIRYADDFLIGLQYQWEAKELLQDLTIRLAKFGLTLSLEKTRLIEFGRYAKENHLQKMPSKHSKPETFDFLGFTHYCSNTRDGRFALKVRTSQQRLQRSVRAMQSWLKTTRNKITIKEIWQNLDTKIHGHYQYYGVSGNFEGINSYYKQVRRLTFKWMNRRSQKRSWNWYKFSKMLVTFPLPRPKLTYAFYNTW